MATVFLHKQRQHRTESNHPWIFEGEIERIEGDAAAGVVVQVHDHRGRFLAAGYFNPFSKIRVRVIGYEPTVQMDSLFFKSRIEAAWKHRQRFLDEADACRVVYGEADFLPGLIVDKFADVLVIQLLTFGMDGCRDQIVEALIKLFEPQAIVERSDVSVRALEGLEEQKGILYGSCSEALVITENGIRMEVDVLEGQKTGYFFDQRENRAALAPLMSGWGGRSQIELKEIETEGGQREYLPVNKNGKVVTYPYWDGATVLDCFAHTGSFTMHAVKYGAKKVTCLDISEHAISTAKRNAELNGFTDRTEFVTDNAFDFLRREVKLLEERQARAEADKVKVDTSKPLSAGGSTWDVVILDPPAFTKSKRTVDSAKRGYKEINLQGMKLVNEGGYLVTASCSYHMSADLFLDVIRQAARDAGKILRLIEFRGAGKDHPQILGVNEGSYLKFAIFEVRSKAMLKGGDEA